MKTITSHVHSSNASNQNQAADPRPGHYYVSAIDGPAHHLLLGPFSRHADALDRVERVRHYVTAHGGPRAHFMAYGTARMATDFTTPGTANKYLPDLATV